jgi:50S ribosomal protein L16 3-hydroxylase
LKTPHATSVPLFLPLSLLGNISAQQFLDEYWQKKPLLIRNALPKNFAPLTNKEILTLAGYDEAESRLVLLFDDEWTIDHGPFTSTDFRELKKNKAAAWTVLIQDTQHFSFEAHALLAQFNFLPQTRVDDLMVSYAVKGGGVGPHVDSYDVFLCQGSGQRRWQISAQQDLTLKPNMPLKILSQFQPDTEWLLDEGDMLYLPPAYAHHGVAETNDCVTWSVGFRAPSHQELLEAWLDDLRDTLQIDGRAQDKKRKPTNQNNHAAIDAELRTKVQQVLTTAITPQLSDAAFKSFTGRYLSQAKSHVTFDAPDEKLSPTQFSKRAIKDGRTLDLRSRMLYDDEAIYINGERLQLNPHALFVQFANTRQLDSTTLKSASSKVFEALYAQWARGYWQFTI